MQTRSLGLKIGFSLALFLGFVAVTELSAASVTADDFKAILDHDSAHLLKQLKDGSPDKKGIIQSKATAMLIAMYAQKQMDGKDKTRDQQLATLRDNAVKVAEAVSSKKYKDAVEAAKLLSLKTAANPSAKTEAIDLSKLAKFEMFELMSPLKKTSGGGLNLESDLKEMADKLKDASKVPGLAARILTIAEYTENMPTDTGSGKKSVANWKKYAKMMKDAADEVYEGSKAAKPDLKKLQTSLGKLNASCTECHNVFKN